MEHITVTVQAADPLTEAGLLSLLRRQPGIELSDPRRPVPGHIGGTVAIAVADRISEAATAELRDMITRHRRRVVLVAAPLRRAELVRALGCGVRALVWRHQVSSERLGAAVRAAARGVHHLPPEIVDQLLMLMELAPGGTQSSTGPGGGLAPREADVVRLLAEGLETRQVAEKLSYSERTVKNILHRLTTRLGLNNRTHAVAYAIREGHI